MQKTIVPVVFVSYASPDRERVLPFYEFLIANGIDAWMDVKKLLAGQHWEFEIKKVLDQAALVVMFISERSIDRTGFIQKELRIALDKLEERPLHHIYLIPIVLDRGIEPPDPIKNLHYLFADDPDCYSQLLKAVHHPSTHTARDGSRPAQKESDIEWSFDRLTETWEGLPGYNVEVTWPTYRSDKYSNIAQAAEIIKGMILSAVASERGAKFHQSTDLFSLEQNEWSRTNSYNVECHDPSICGSVLSQHISVHTNGAGAAHPNHTFRTWVFTLDPLVEIKSLVQIFDDIPRGLITIQTESREQVLQKLEVSHDGTMTLDGLRRWVEEGTSNLDAFEHFTFGPNDLVLLSTIPSSIVCRRTVCGSHNLCKIV